MLHVCYMLSIVQLRSLGFQSQTRSDGRKGEKSIGAWKLNKSSGKPTKKMGNTWENDEPFCKNDGTYMGKWRYMNSEPGTSEAILNHSKMEHRWLSQIKQWIWGCPMKKVHFRRIGGQTMQQFWRTRARWVEYLVYTIILCKSSMDWCGIWLWYGILMYMMEMMMFENQNLDPSFV